MTGHGVHALVALTEKKPALQVHEAAELEPWGAAESARHCETVPLKQKPTEQSTHATPVLLPVMGA